MSLFTGFLQPFQAGINIGFTRTDATVSIHDNLFKISIDVPTVSVFSEMHPRGIVSELSLETPVVSFVTTSHFVGALPSIDIDQVTVFPNTVKSSSVSVEPLAIHSPTASVTITNDLHVNIPDLVLDNVIVSTNIPLVPDLFLPDLELVCEPTVTYVLTSHVRPTIPDLPFDDLSVIALNFDGTLESTRTITASGYNRQMTAEDADRTVVTTFQNERILEA